MDVDIEIQLNDDDEENELTIEEKRRLNILRNREFMQQIGLEGASKLLSTDNEGKELKKLEKKPKEIIPKGEERRSSRIVLKPKVDYTEKKQKYNKVERRKLNDDEDGDGDDDFEWRGSQRRSSKSPRNKYKLRIHKNVDYSLLDVFEFDDSDHNSEILSSKKRAVSKEGVQSNQRKKAKRNEGSESENEEDSDYNSGEEETENQKTNTNINKNEGKSHEDNDNNDNKNGHNNDNKNNNGNGSDSESTTSGSSDYTENNNTTTTPKASTRRSNRRESTSSSSQTPIKQIVSMNNVSTRQNSHDTPIVMFTGVDEFEKWKTVVHSLGGEIEEKEVSRITHLVVNCVKTTEKFLSCISRSPPPKIMDLRWLAASLRTREFVDEKKFLLKDRENEQKYDFKLSEALSRSEKKALFKGTKIYVSPDSAEKMMSLSKAIKMAEGTTIFSVPTLYLLSKIGNNFYVICDQEGSEEVKHIHSTHIKSTKWVVESLLTQTLLGMSDNNSNNDTNSGNSSNDKGNEDSSVDSDN